ncbi:hypothetical protein P3L10_009271 [Capsicum annuum]
MAEETGKSEKGNEKVCKRCKQTYSAASNNSNSCRFHPSFFVCRRHDDQKRTHIPGLAEKKQVDVRHDFWA